MLYQFFIDWNSILSEDGPVTFQTMWGAQKLAVQCRVQAVHWYDTCGTAGGS
jgi:hypothetical protein